MAEIVENLRAVREQIHQSCAKVGRNPEEVLFVAVTKGVSSEKILEAFRLGITSFGENRIQEARAKINQLPGELKWHMIGHLQSNKAKDAVAMFDMIQSVDSLRLADRLQHVAQGIGKKLDVLLEINIGREATKFGFLENEVEEVFHKAKRLENLRVKGLMAVAPFLENLEDVRPYFKRMKKLFSRLGGLEILSMGMSHDFAIAIEEGSTMIRVGQALFGPRKL